MSCPECQFASGLCATLSLALLAAGAQAAEISTLGGASVEYRYDDNVRVTPTNRVSLSGWKAEASGDIKYATPRFAASADLKLSSDKYDNADTADLSPGVAEPSASDFDSDNQDLKGSLAYDWERHHLNLDGEYSRDSTLNTQFVDTGLGGPAQIEGATRRESATVSPGWRWDLTERQQLESTLMWQSVDYQSAFYVDYDFSSAIFNWSYLLDERLQLQVAPQLSYYENQSANKVESTTYGLQVGAIWTYSEKLRLDLLAGATEVNTTIDGGYYVFDPVNFQIVFVEYDDQNSRGFTGSFTAEYTEQRYGIVVDMFSRYSPSADGGLREDVQGTATWYWLPVERLRLDVDSRYGWSDNTDGNYNRGKREYGEAGIRVGYQFAREWWLSARYRYRTQKYDQSRQGSGDSNLLSAGISYRLPKEIL